jgi:hypothetical protein
MQGMANDWHYIRRDRRPIDLPDCEDEEDDYDEEALCRLMVWRMLEEDVRFENPGVSCAEFLKDAETHTAEWGMKPVKALAKMAEKFDAELATTVSVETKAVKK